MTWPLRSLLVSLSLALLVGSGGSDVGGGPRMRVEVNIDGGFAAIPGLSKPITVDSADLSSDQRKELEGLVDAAFAEKARSGTTKKVTVPDGRHYRITVQRGGSRDGVEADDPVTPPAFAALLDFVKANGRSG